MNLSTFFFSAKTRHFQWCLGEAKPLDTPVNYEKRLYFTMQKNVSKKFTFSLVFTNKNRVGRINPPPTHIKYDGKNAASKVSSAAFIVKKR